MANLEIASRRLHNQHISSALLDDPAAVVGWLGAVQAQDYAGAKWALGLRIQEATDDAVESAFAEGLILRTHLLRPTWHFVLLSDIKWVLAATAPRVHALNAYYYRQLELDDALLARTNDLLAKALEGGNQLTRPELMAVLQREGIEKLEGLRASYIMMRAELDGIVCSGARRGNQFTYALLDERAPHARTLPHDEAVAELAKRYFTSHGPATLQDLMWWSSLTTAEAKAGLDLAKDQLASEEIDGRIYWSSASGSDTSSIASNTPQAYLLPNYDEYISYKDRGAIFDPAHSEKMNTPDNRTFPHFIVMGGMIAGTWRRTVRKDTVIVETNPFEPFGTVETAALRAAAGHYGRFLGLPVTLT